MTELEIANKKIKILKNMLKEKYEFESWIEEFLSNGKTKITKSLILKNWDEQIDNLINIKLKNE